MAIFVSLLCIVWEFLIGNYLEIELLSLLSVSCQCVAHNDWSHFHSHQQHLKVPFPAATASFLPHHWQCTNLKCRTNHGDQNETLNNHSWTLTTEFLISSIVCSWGLFKRWGCYYGLANKPKLWGLLGKKTKKNYTVPLFITIAIVT